MKTTLRPSDNVAELLFEALSRCPDKELQSLAQAMKEMQDRAGGSLQNCKRNNPFFANLWQSMEEALSYNNIQADDTVAIPFENNGRWNEAK